MSPHLVRLLEAGPDLLLIWGAIGITLRSQWKRMAPWK